MKTHYLLGRLSFLALIWLLVAAPPAFASTDNGTLTVGRTTVSCGGPTLTFSGYSVPLAIGSYSPTGLTGGKTVTGVWDLTGGCGTSSTLQVSGFSSNPGSSWLTSITCNGVTNLASAVSTFSYSGGGASWTWNSTTFGIWAKSVGANVSCTIVHS